MLKIINGRRLKELEGKAERLEEMEAKGFYAGDDNRLNEYLKRVARMAEGVKLPPVDVMDRDEIQKAYERSGAVMGVVNYIAENVGEVARYLEMKDKRTGDYVDNHWVLDLINRPNDRFTTRKFLTAWAINKLLYGDAWVYAPKAVGKDLGKITEMYVIPSHRIATDNGSAIAPLKGVKIIGVDDYSTIEMKDVFESFDYNLDDESYFGTSKIVAAATYLDVMDKGMRRESTALDNGGVSNIITPKPDAMGIKPADQTALEKKANSIDNAGKTVVLRLPVEVQQLGNAPVDLNILEGHKEAVTALCFVYKIPVDLYYGQAKYENAKEAKKTIYEQNAIPMANEFAEDLLRHIGLSADYELAVNTEKIDVLKANASETMNVLTSMYASINEKRIANGYAPIEEDYANLPIVPAGTQFGEGFNFDISEGSMV